MAERVVVTSMGVVSCIGQSVAAFRDALMAGRCGLGLIRRLRLDNFPYRCGGEVADAPGEDAEVSRSVRFCTRAAREAVAALPSGTFDPVRAAVVLSTNFGPMDTMERGMALAREGRPAPAGLFEQSLPAYPTLRVAEALGFRGPSTTLSLSCASGGAAIGYGAELIRGGVCDVVLAGGYDTIELTSWAGLGVLRVMAPTPEEGVARVRPFDKNRDGTLFSEGAAFLLLESERHARGRGATPLAVMAGWATNNNAHHMTHADAVGEATAEVMSAALRDAGLPADGIDHINAHGTGTALNDKIETTAIRTVFGGAADTIPVTSIKGTVGHGMGAAGAFEAVACVLSIGTSAIPPTINYETPDPECDLRIVANSALRSEVRAAISASAGIGGCNSAVVLTSGD